MPTQGSILPGRGGALTAATLVLLAGCAASTRRGVVYTPAEMRAEIARRAPGLDPEEVVVPFEVPAPAIERVRRLVSRQLSADDQVRTLIEVVLTSRGFGLAYAPIITTPPAETLASRRGNCLSLASVFIGLARSLGLDAVYVDASARLSEESQPTPGLVVNSGHITAMVEINRRRWYLDFDQTLGPVASLRVIDDLEALAHFYNNRAFEKVETDVQDGKPIDWREAIRDFERAVAVAPGFSRAWNNLGLAHARTGRLDEAEDAYLRAIATDPRSGSAYNNLGALYLSQNRLPLAIEELEKAVKLEPRKAFVHLNLGRAYILAHDLEAAERELREAADLHDDVAKRLLGKIAHYRRTGGQPTEDAARLPVPGAEP